MVTRAGAFVARHIVAPLSVSSDPAMRRLLLESDSFVKSDAGATSSEAAIKSVIDEGVYTRNRNFRLFLSSKVTKGVPLVLAKRCT